MNPDLFSFYPKFLLDEKTGTDKTPKLQIFDTTPYTDNDIPLAGVFGVISSAKRENVQFYANTDYSDPDVTLSPAVNVKVDLPVDADDNTLYGDYSFDYAVKCVGEIIGTHGLLDTALTAGAHTSCTLYSIPDGATVVANINTLVGLIGDDFKIVFKSGTGAILFTSIVTGASLSTDVTITFESITVGATSITDVDFNTYYSGTVEVSYAENVWGTPLLSVTGDCIRATVSAVDQTVYQASDTLTRTLTLNYPTQEDGTPMASPVVTSTASILIGPPVSSGAYAIYLSSQLVRIQDDTLVLQQTIKAYNPFNLECDAGLCCIRECIGSIFTQYQTALTTGSQNLSVLRDNVITIMGYVSLYTMAIDCGDTQGASNELTALQSYMDLIGCNCGCGDCGSESTVPTWIYPLFSNPIPNYVPISYLEIDAVTTNSNTKVPTNKAVLATFYKKTDTYSQSEVNALLPNYDNGNTDTGAAAVTINEKSGLAKFTNNISADSAAVFRLNNSLITENSFIWAYVSNYGGDGYPIIQNLGIGAGYCDFTVYNMDLTLLTSTQVEISFIVL